MLCTTEMATILMRRRRSPPSQDRPTLNARGKALAKEGAPEDHVVVCDGEGNRQHSNYEKGPLDVEGLRCCPTRYPP